MIKILRAFALSTLVCLAACGGGSSDSPPAEPAVTLPKPLDIMSYGITTFTADGNLAITSAAAAMHFIGQATYTGNVTEPNVFGPFQRYTISSPGGLPMPFYRITPNSSIWYESPLIRFVSGSTYEILVRTNMPSGDVPIFCFAKLADGTPPAEAWGVRVLNSGSSGGIQYDSTRRPLQIHSLVALPAVARNTSPMPSNSATGSLWDATGATLPPIPGVFVGVNGGAAGGFQGGSKWNGVALTLATGSVQRVVGSRWGGNTDFVNFTSGWLGEAPTVLIDLTPYL
jgi:hypothetical protein